MAIGNLLSSVNNIVNITVTQTVSLRFRVRFYMEGATVHLYQQKAERQHKKRWLQTALKEGEVRIVSNFNILKTDKWYLKFMQSGLFLVFA